MDNSLKLMAILAHPDDESLGMGGTLAKYATEELETYLVTATRGEKGWFGDPGEHPGATRLGRIRENELREAANVLDLDEVIVLDYVDGELDQARHDKIVPQLVQQIRRVKPDVVITFDPFGAYGHPDHIAICQFTTTAIMCAADPTYEKSHGGTHSVSKLYYRVQTAAELTIYQQAFGELIMHIDGMERRGVGWKDWAITAKISTLDYHEQIWKAIACHETQLPGYDVLNELPHDAQRILWHSETYYRAMSLVSSGRQQETDLFAGLR